MPVSRSLHAVYKTFISYTPHNAIAFVRAGARSMPVACKELPGCSCLLDRIMLNSYTPTVQLWGKNVPIVKNFDFGKEKVKVLLADAAGHIVLDRAEGVLEFHTRLRNLKIRLIPGANFFLGGLQDNGTLLYQEGFLPYFIFVSGGDGSYCFIDEDEPWYQITSVYRNLYYFIDASNEWQQYRYESFYGTGTFINPADYDSRLNTLFANGMTFTGEFNNRLVVIDHIPQNPNGRFVRLNTGSNVPYSHVHVSRYSPLESTTLYVGTQSGRLFRIKNTQNIPSVKEITGNNFPSGNISSVAMGGSEDTLLVTFSNYGVESVWLTTDNGATWESKEGNLPDMPVRWSILLPQNANKAVLATEIGVWTTDDLSSNPVVWIPANNGMANVRVDMLRLRRSDNTLLAATHGRGFFTMEFSHYEEMPKELAQKVIDEARKGKEEAK